MDNFLVEPKKFRFDPSYVPSVVSSEEAKKVVGTLGLSSPARCNVKEGLPPTPPTVERGRHVLREKRLNSVILSPGSEGTILSTLSKIGQMSEPGQIHHSKKIKKLLVDSSEGEEELPFASPDSVKKVNSLLTGLNGDFASGLILKLNDFSPAPEDRLIGVDTPHIVDGVDGGFHFCPEGDSKESELTDIVKNPNNGVRIALRKGKVSTIFPSNVATEEDLMSKLILPDWEAHRTNKSRKSIQALCKIGDGEKAYYMLQYLTHSGASIRTAYPFFAVFDLETMEEEVSIDGAYSCKKSEIVAFLRSEVRSKSINNRILLSDSSGRLLIRLDNKCPGVTLSKGIACFVLPATIGMTKK